MSSPDPYDPASGPRREPPRPGEVVPGAPAPAPAVSGPRRPAPAGARTARRLRTGGGWAFWVSLVLGLLFAALTITSIVQVATTGADTLGDAQRLGTEERTVPLDSGERLGVFVENETVVDGTCTVSDGGAIDRSLTLLPGADVRYGGQSYQELASWTAPSAGEYTVACDQDGLLLGDAQPVHQLPWWTAGIVVGALGTVAALLPLVIGGVLWLAGRLHRDLVR